MRYLHTLALPLAAAIIFTSCSAAPEQSGNNNAQGDKDPGDTSGDNLPGDAGGDNGGDSPNPGDGDGDNCSQTVATDVDGDGYGVDFAATAAYLSNGAWC